ncbi:hypothetical protein AB0L26_20920 [Streptomyces nondiastaticus]|uniref:hypothetical protein n=1 Tax=Streptomyces nondiastaticus TaxID=3154512 RepID=UPI003426C2A7
MARRLPPPPCNVEELIPELSGLARETTLLYPRSGSPGVHDSSIGGPLLWPADEPWPMCSEPDHWKPLRKPVDVVGPEPVAMVAVAQLYARDLPELPFPPGRDVLQILWCPLIHEGDVSAARPELYWRSAHETAAAGAGILAEPPQPYEYDEEFVPQPSTVSPTKAVEYPNWDMPPGLSQTLEERFEAFEERLGASYWDVATTIQSKAGGYPGWTQPPSWPDCACGRRMEHLLSITATEPGYGRWLPLDEHRADSRKPMVLTEADPAVFDAIGHGMDMGGLKGMYFFVCRTCPGMPFSYRYDC